jgi:hypothetical protein
MAMNTRRLYRSANGDRWDLARDTATGRVFIRHEANEPAAGMALSTPSCCVSSERSSGSAPMPKGPKLREARRRRDRQRCPRDGDRDRAA